MDDVCKELDTVVLEFFQTLTDFYMEQEKLGETLKSGLLNMSRARYSMGTQAVTIDKCDNSKMVAAVKVKVSHDNQLTSFKPNPDLEAQFCEINLGGQESNFESSIRKRTVTNKKNVEGYVNGSSHIEDIELNEKQKKSDHKKVVDPLNWFGVLVPPALRQSQQDFKKTIESGVNVANLKLRLQTLQAKYETLLAQKKDLKKNDK